MLGLNTLMPGACVDSRQAFSDSSSLASASDAPATPGGSHDVARWPLSGQVTVLWGQAGVAQTSHFLTDTLPQSDFRGWADDQQLGLSGGHTADVAAPCQQESDVSRATCKGRPGSEGMSSTSTWETQGHLAERRHSFRKQIKIAEQPVTHGEIYSDPGRLAAASGRGGELGGGGRMTLRGMGCCAEEHILKSAVVMATHAVSSLKVTERDVCPGGDFTKSH